MTTPGLILVLASAFLIVILLSHFIYARAASHLGRASAAYVHLFIAAVALYYLADTLFRLKEKFSGLFSIYWLVVTASQVGLFFYKRRFLQKAKTSAEVFEP